MKMTRRLYRYCPCQHRLTIHVRGRPENDATGPAQLVCEECRCEEDPAAADESEAKRDRTPPISIPTA